MRYQYYLPSIPSLDEQQTIQDRFLPTFGIIIFAANPRDSDFRLQSVYSRRLPQVMKMKMDMAGKFNSSFILPLEKTTSKVSYLDGEADVPFIDPEFMESFQRLDYYLGGSLSLDAGFIEIKLYSLFDKKIILQKKYYGKKNEFVRLAGHIVLDIFNFLEIALSPDEIEAVLNRPTQSPESLEYFLEALDSDPANPFDNLDENIFLDYLFKSLREDPSNEEVLGLLTGFAEKLHRNTRSEKAKEILEEALKINPNARNVVTLLARIIRNEQRIGQIVDFLEERIPKDEGLRTLPFLLALENMQTEFNKNTIILFEKALKFAPDNPAIYDSYGYFLMSQGEAKEALDIFKRGLELSPDREITLLNTAQAYAQNGDLSSAKNILEKAKELYPDSPKVLVTMAIFQALKGEAAEAEKLAREAIDRCPEDPLINLTASRVFHHLGNSAESLRLARTAIDLNPSREIAEEAHIFFSRVAANISEEQQQKNREIFMDAVMALRKDQWQQAIQLIDEVVKVEPQFWRAWFFKGIAHRMMGEYEKALASFANVDELFPDQVYLRHEIGKCYMGLNNFSEAFPHIRYAFRHHPEDPEIMFNMAICYMYLGRLQEAEILFRQVRKMDPSSKNVDVYMNELERLKKRKRASRGNGDTN